jgi:hypothetical protein
MDRSLSLGDVETPDVFRFVRLPPGAALLAERPVGGPGSAPFEGRVARKRDAGTREGAVQVDKRFGRVLAGGGVACGLP